LKSLKLVLKRLRRLSKIAKSALKVINVKGNSKSVHFKVKIIIIKTKKPTSLRIVVGIVKMIQRTP